MELISCGTDLILFHRKVDVAFLEDAFTRIYNDTASCYILIALAAGNLMHLPITTVRLCLQRQLISIVLHHSLTMLVHIRRRNHK